MADEVQEIADVVGDSFYLSKKAKELEEDILVFCGVSFMGESAKILNPNKQFYTINDNQICPDMKYITFQKIYDVLKNESNAVEMDETKRQRALKPLECMLELAK